MAFDAGQGVKGGAGGALAGAALGSAIAPGFGTAVGAIAGGGLGLLSGFGGNDKPQLEGEAERKQRLLQMAQAQGIPPEALAAQLGPAAQSGVSGFRGDQSALIRQLQQEAAGQGVGQQLIRQQVGDQLQTGIGQQIGLSRGGGPGNAALMARQGAQQIGQLQGGAQNAIANATMQARLGAMGQLGGVLQGARGQDIGQSQFNAGAQNQFGLQQGAFQQQANLANQQAVFQARQQQNMLAQLELQNAMAGANIGIQGAQIPGFGDQLLGAGAGVAGLAFGQNAGQQAQLGGGGGFASPQGAQTGGLGIPLAQLPGGLVNGGRGFGG